MRNLLSVSSVFDAREYIGSSIDASFPYPYTFLLSQGEFICSPFDLPQQLIPTDMFEHGLGFATRAAAEYVRGKVIEILADADLLVVVQRITVALPDSGVVVCDFPGDAVTYIQKLEKDVPDPEIVLPVTRFYTTNHKEGDHLHFKFRPSKRHHYDIQLVQHIPASSAIPPLLNWDAIGIK